jgi:hypothetical protein
MSGPNSSAAIGQQDYRTPAWFLNACKDRFGLERIDWDLACSAHDCVGESGGYTYPQIDSLKEDWYALESQSAACWCNPPFAQSGAFAEKAASTVGLRSLLLVPVAIGTRWWRQHVHRKAVVAGVGRLVFNNADGAPVCGKNGKPQGINRDCALLAYNMLPSGTDWYLLEDWKSWRKQSFKV